jgi:hypothetical protein
MPQWGDGSTNAAPRYTTKSAPFLNMVHTEIGLRHLSCRTKELNVYSIVQFIRFQCNQHPLDLGPDSRAVMAFESMADRTHLAT